MVPILHNLFPFIPNLIQPISPEIIFPHPPIRYPSNFPYPFHFFTPNYTFFNVAPFQKYLNEKVLRFKYFSNATFPPSLDYLLLSLLYYTTRLFQVSLIIKPSKLFDISKFIQN